MTLYADEVERTAGAIATLLKGPGMAEPERAYWMGAANALWLLLSLDMPEGHEAFVAALKLHWEGA